jgi:sigma-54 specific flagellar transcriptional regulator A
MDVTRAAGAAQADQLGAESARNALPHVFPDGLVCCLDSPLIELRRTCVRVAASAATVLLTGETGTGKEVFARLIHAHSPRAKRQFVPVNCGAIPEALLESELFGYVKGAFTGAVTPRRGRVALAEGGTLFLDEIGELPLALQVKLLRLLQQRTYEPVGSSESITADFRLVAATNRDLLQEVRAGRFRQDLYYRLNVCPLHLPPLRVRPGDVTALFLHFWKARGETRPLEPGVLARLENHDWPGNVRELENLVERVSVIAEGNVIRVLDLPSPLGDPDPSHGDSMSQLLMPSLAAPPPARTLASSPPVGTAPPVASASPAGVAEGYARPAPPPARFLPDPDDEPSQVRPLPGPVQADPGSVAVAVAVAEVVAELSAASTSAASLSSSSSSADASLMPSQGNTPPALPVQPLPVNLPVLLRELEEAYIAQALAQSGGNKKEAARLLGMGRTTLVEKLRRRNADTSTP